MGEVRYDNRIFCGETSSGYSKDREGNRRILLIWILGAQVVRVELTWCRSEV
jgi:hypothetical protein